MAGREGREKRAMVGNYQRWWKDEGDKKNKVSGRRNE